MCLAITPDKPRRADDHSRVIAGSSGALRKTGDDHHPAPFRQVDQPLCGRSIRYRFRQRDDFLLRHKLITGRTQLWQDDQIRLSLGERFHNRIEIVRYLAEKWSELKKPDAHDRHAPRTKRAGLPLPVQD